MVDMVAGPGAHSQVEVGASPRGSLALLKTARARAAVAGRDFVTPDDVKAVAMPALAHRLTLKPDPWIRGVRTSAVLGDVLGQVRVPKVPCHAYALGERPGGGRTRAAPLGARARELAARAPRPPADHRPRAGLVVPARPAPGRRGAVSLPRPGRGRPSRGGPSPCSQRRPRPGPRRDR